MRLVKVDPVYSAAVHTLVGLDVRLAPAVVEETVISLSRWVEGEVEIVWFLFTSHRFHVRYINSIQVRVATITNE